MKHINEVRFKGDSPFEKAMNIANDYWTKFSDETLPEKERDDAYESWAQIRYELETGKYS